MLGIVEKRPAIAGARMVATGRESRRAPYAQGRERRRPRARSPPAGARPPPARGGSRGLLRPLPVARPLAVARRHVGAADDGAPRPAAAARAAGRARPSE